MGRMKELCIMRDDGMSIEQISEETGIEFRVLKKLFWSYDKRNKNGMEHNTKRT